MGASRDAYAYGTMRGGLLRVYSTSLGAINRVLDATLVVLGGMLAYQLRFGVAGVGLSTDYDLVALVAALLAAMLFPAFGVYGSWRARGLRAPVMQALAGWMAVFALTLLLLVIFKENERFSRIWMALWFAATGTGLVVVRLLVFGILRTLRAHGHNRRRAVIVGGGAQAAELVARCRRAGWAGFDVAAAFHSRESAGEHAAGTLEGVPLRPLSELGRFVREGGVDEVWISLPLQESAVLEPVLAQLRHSTANIRYAPDLLGLFLLNRGVTEILDTPMLDLSASPMLGIDHVLKRAEDVLLSLLILLLASPVMLLIALAVKLGSPGPVLYRQRRHGWNGRQIEVWKFRSMHVHREPDGEVIQARRDDPRLTRFGALLRRTSLDELPQFFNVLQGRMSIVGPRPHAVEHNQAYVQLIEHYALRHKVKPGITGWAQVNGWRGETDTIDKMRRRVEHDLYYIEHWSLLFDLRIIALTPVRVFTDRNAY